MSFFFAGLQGYGRKRMRALPASEIPTMISKFGTSRWPAERCARPILRDQRLHERLGLHADPLRSSRSQLIEITRQRRRGCGLVGVEVVAGAVVQRPAARRVLLVPSLAERKRADDREQPTLLFRRDEIVAVRQPMRKPWLAGEQFSLGHVFISKSADDRAAACSRTTMALASSSTWGRSSRWQPLSLRGRSRMCR